MQSGSGGRGTAARRRNVFVVLGAAAASLLALAFSTTACAAQSHMQPPEIGPADDLLTLKHNHGPPRAPDSIDHKLAEAKERPAGLFKYGPVSLIDPLLRNIDHEAEKIGLKVGFALTAAYQAASGGPGDRDAAAYNAEIFGNWRLLGEEGGDNNGLLYFSAEYKDALCTPITPKQLAGQIGSLWDTSGFSDGGLAFKKLYWQQHIDGYRLVISAGKLDPTDYYDSNYWQSDTKYFMNQAFSSFPVRSFPGSGLGLNLTSRLNRDWYISTGVHDAQGKESEAGFDTFFDDFDLFTAGEVGYTPTIAGVGRGVYRFTGWYRAAGESDGTPYDTGFDISFDQRVGPNLIPFFRYGVGKGNINGIQQMISAGAGWEGAMITESDVVGIAGSWGQPSDDNLRDQYVTEVFYRLQVSPDNHFTIGYQLIIDPSNNPDQDVVGVFEVRWRIVL